MHILNIVIFIVFDIKNAHGASIEALNLFGKYTKNFADIRAARNLIKAGKVDEAKATHQKDLAYLTVEEQNVYLEVKQAFINLKISASNFSSIEL